MKRMTVKRKDGRWALANDDGASNLEQLEKLPHAIARLAAIENILGDEYNLDHLRELVQAEKDGRLLVLPCKVGDTVWAITSPINIAGMASDNEGLEIFECTVDSTTVYKSYTSSPIQFRLYYHGEFVAWYVTDADFGKTVFLTREEAETALETGGTDETDPV